MGESTIVNSNTVINKRISILGKRGSDPEAVPWHSEDPGEAVQGVQAASVFHHTQGGAEVGHQEAEGGADEEAGHAGPAVWDWYIGDDAAAECELWLDLWSFYCDQAGPSARLWF